MRLHLIGLPHTQLVRDTVVCAFTAKAHKFVEMMKDYDVVAYWGDECDIERGGFGFEHVKTFSAKEQEKWFGKIDPNVLPTLPVWNGNDPHWQTMNKRVIKEIKKRIEPGDLILSLAGYNQQMITREFPNNIACEWAAGYPGWCEPFVCFESYSWMHHCYGLRGIGDGRWFDTVIPNFFRPYEFSVDEDAPRDYLLYVGRLISRKGIHTAWEIARTAGIPLVLAGSGAASFENGTLTTLDGCVLPDVEYVGPVGAEERNRLMSGALATIVATTYIEPFGATAVESQLCGTPVLATDWGAFPETVEHGFGGFRFRTLHEAVTCIDALEDLPPAVDIRERAFSVYSLDAVEPMYDRWFRSLHTLYGDGWYSLGDASDVSATIDADE